jgi:hypothetical protein
VRLQSPRKPHKNRPHGAGGRSSGVEHNLAKVGVVGSNPIARSKFFYDIRALKNGRREAAVLVFTVVSTTT